MNDLALIDTSAPVAISAETRADAVRARLAEPGITETGVADAVAWARTPE